MFENSTVFYVPFLLKDYKGAVTHFMKNADFAPTPAKALKTNYLLRYASDIAKDEKRFSSFRHTAPEALCLYLYENLFEGCVPCLRELRVSFFSTCIGFVEITVGYGDMPLSDIVTFVSKFKSTTRPKDDDLPKERYRVYETVCRLLPADAVPFFTGGALFKYNAHCFHMIKTEKDAYSPEEYATYLRLLRRNYGMQFAAEEVDEGGEFDMEYTPYAYDRWGGSQEGFVNIVSKTGDTPVDYFIDNYKYDHLNLDYRFLYLLLLNQRYTAIHYIDRIAEADMNSSRAIDRLNVQIVELKTQFSFRVISNDKIYQNIYLRLYNILDIDNLLKDLQDNEAQIAVLRDASAARSDKMASKFLFGLSLLSVFSALIDATGYFEKFSRIGDIAVWLSLACTVFIVTLCLLWIFRDKDR